MSLRYTLAFALATFTASSAATALEQPEGKRKPAESPEVLQLRALLDESREQNEELRERHAKELEETRIGAAYRLEAQTWQRKLERDVATGQAYRARQAEARSRLYRRGADSFWFPGLGQYRMGHRLRGVAYGTVFTLFTASAVVSYNRFAGSRGALEGSDAGAEQTLQLSMFGATLTYFWSLYEALYVLKPVQNSALQLEPEDAASWSRPPLPGRGVTVISASDAITIGFSVRF